MGHDSMFLSARCDPILGGHELKNEKTGGFECKEMLGYTFLKFQTNQYHEIGFFEIIIRIC